MRGFVIIALIAAVYFQQSSKFGNARVVRMKASPDFSDEDLQEFYDDLFDLNDDDKCEDASPSDCPARFDFKYCQKNYNAMLKKCRKTCHLCEVVKPPSPGDCKNEHPDCEDMIAKHVGYCAYTPIAREKECRKSCGTCFEGTKEPPLPLAPIKDKCEDKLPNCQALIAADEDYCRISAEVKDDLCQKSCGNCGEKQPQQPFPDAQPKVCKDEHPDCAEMISKHHMYCAYTKIAREKECRKSCGTCSDNKQPHPNDLICKDLHPDCKEMISKHHMYCDYTEIAREKECRKSCGTCTSGEKPPLPIPTNPPKGEKRPLPLPTEMPEGEKTPPPLPTGSPGGEKQPRPLPTGLPIEP